MSLHRHLLTNMDYIKVIYSGILQNFKFIGLIPERMRNIKTHIERNKTEEEIV